MKKEIKGFEEIIFPSLLTDFMAYEICGKNGKGMTRKEADFITKIKNWYWKTKALKRNYYYKNYETQNSKRGKVGRRIL